ncbi:MAG: AAA family ATPase [Actinomycetota bacterium]
MIRIERSAPAPGVLDSDDTREARAEARDWAERVARRTRSSANQKPFHPRDVVRSREVEGALAELFHGKCAFCETRLGTGGPTEVTWYRPPSAATGAEGDASLAHYAWLAYDWDNLYPACESCSRARGRRFPVEGRKRAPVGSHGPALDAERPLLLDPCRDDCDALLVFTDDGRVSSHDRRAMTTIGVFDLNRPALVEGRRGAVEEVRAAWATGPVEEAHLAPSTEFAGARRQAARRLVAKQPSAAPGPPATPPATPGPSVREAGAAPPRTAPQVLDYDDHVVIGGVRLAKRSLDEERSAQEATAAAQTKQAAYSLHDRGTDELYFATARYVERVEVRNFRPIAHLDLAVPLGGDTAGWLMLVGENAAGKSSFLTAVALALMGQPARDALGLDARRYVRKGARSGEVRVWLTGLSEPMNLEFDTRRPGFTGTPDPKVLLLGYGATRLLPRHPAEGPSPDAIADFDNLFDPFVPLVDATAWLLSLQDDQFTAAARGLAGLLEMDEGDALTRHPSSREVRCRKKSIGRAVRIEELSDGYQSVVALAVDIMAVLLNRWSDLSAAEGVVVLDELGAHLHPRWRMRIVSSLRECFPRVQFLVTTHDPLCLKGLRDGEAVVMERLADEERTVVARTDLPPVAGMRADQLLTSEFFGLRSTIDPSLDAQFDEYFRLKGARSRTAAEEARLAELAAVLEPLRVLGETPRERLAFEAAERYLADYRATRGPLEAAQVKEAALEDLRGIWGQSAPERFT